MRTRSCRSGRQGQVSSGCRFTHVPTRGEEKYQFDAVGNSELVVDFEQVILNRVLADAEPFADLSVREAFCR